MKKIIEMRRLKMKRNLNKILMLSVKSFYQERQEYATIGEIATTHYPLYLLWGIL